MNLICQCTQVDHGLAIQAAPMAPTCGGYRQVVLHGRCCDRQDHLPAGHLGCSLRQRVSLCGRPGLHPQQPHQSTGNQPSLRVCMRGGGDIFEQFRGLVNHQALSWCAHGACMCLQLPGVACCSHRPNMSQERSSGTWQQLSPCILTCKSSQQHASARLMISRDHNCRIAELVHQLGAEGGKGSQYCPAYQCVLGQAALHLAQN